MKLITAWNSKLRIKMILKIRRMSILENVWLYYSFVLTLNIRVFLPQLCLLNGLISLASFQNEVSLFNCFWITFVFLVKVHVYWLDHAAFEFFLLFFLFLAWNHLHQKLRIISHKSYYLFPTGLNVFFMHN